jgi:glycosyltransferase involved in cell wall biosynthesis
VCLLGFQSYPHQPQLRRDSATLVERGYDVTVIARRREGQPARESLPGIEIYRIPVDRKRGNPLRYVWQYGAFFVLAFLTLSGLHLRKRFRVVEVINMPDLLVFTALVPKLMGARVILVILDNMPEILRASRNMSPRHPLVWLLGLQERISARFADRVVVTQDMARRAVVARGTPSDKLTIVLNSPEETVFPDAPPPPRPRRAGRFDIVTHGTILERWGNQVLIEALPLIAREVPEVHAHIIGRGEFQPALERLAAERGVASRVTFHGWVPIEDLPDHINRADLGFVGVLFGMALSNKLLEYAALGLPMVVSRWPSHEQYFPSDSVMYYRSGSPDDLARAVIEVHRDPERARRCAEQAARRYQELFSWKKQRETYLQIYDNLLLTGSERRTFSVAPGT